MRALILAIFILASAAVSSRAGIFDEFKELEGQVVVEAGELKKLTCPINGDYNCLTWPSAFFRLNKLCVEAVGGYVNGYNLKGLLTQGQGSGTSLFIYDGGLGGGDFKRYSVEIYDCPAGVY